MRRLGTPSLESSNKSPGIIHVDDPIGTGYTAETIYAVLLDIRCKVIDLVISLNADFGPGMFGNGKVPHQNRLCFFVTFFAQAKKVSQI